MLGKDFKELKNKKKPKNLSKPAGVREKVIRILDIYTLISRSQYPSIAAMQERFNACNRSIHRYLEIINMIDPIEFDKEKGGYKFINNSRIKKKDKWHPSEKRNTHIEMTYTVSGADEIKRWIYTWMPHVEVIRPNWLRAEIKKEMSASAEKHS